MRNVVCTRNYHKGIRLKLLNITKILILLILVMALSGCATTQLPSTYKPRSINEIRFRDRAQTKSDADLRVSAAVPTAAETSELFQADLIRRSSAGTKILPARSPATISMNATICGSGTVAFAIRADRSSWGK